ncbi:MAG: hypothetical protein GXP08_03575 [Gammaproteobacteria bacterium]|nr:hypothetical protein [Gammaproteobacteria bacterium]
MQEKFTDLKATTKVLSHDFPDKKLGKAVPYGVYDIALNKVSVSIGINHDTAEFAVAAEAIKTRGGVFRESEW